MEEIKFYSNIFDFIEFSLHDEEIGKIKIKNFTFYIVSEK